MTMQDAQLYEKFQRQIILKDFGEQAQQKLLAARVLVIGAGGLGCPALLYLAAAGVGTIGVIDDDSVALNNLHRQVLYGVADVGAPKAEKAAITINALHPEIKIIPYPFRLTTENCLDLFRQYNIILDGTDNFASRYMINDACVLLGKPLVFGAVSQYEGQVAVFSATPEGVNYRDLFPQPPKAGEVFNCAEAGVLGVLPGVIGTMQAAEVIKLVTGIGEPLINRLFTINLLNYQTFDLALSKRKDTTELIPATEAAFRQTDYAWLCGVRENTFEIDAKKFLDLTQNGNTAVIDVREPHELPEAPFIHQRIPLSTLPDAFPGIPSDTVIFVCQTGQRSLQAANWAAEQDAGKQFYSLQGGILNWKNHD